MVATRLSVSMLLFVALEWNSLWGRACLAVATFALAG